MSLFSDQVNCNAGIYYGLKADPVSRRNKEDVGFTSFTLLEVSLFIYTLITYVFVILLHQ